MNQGMSIGQVVITLINITCGGGGGPKLLSLQRGKECGTMLKHHLHENQLNQSVLE
jgi:hypothetical protein